MFREIAAQLTGHWFLPPQIRYLYGGPCADSFGPRSARSACPAPELPGGSQSFARNHCVPVIQHICGKRRAGRAIPPAAFRRTNAPGLGMKFDGNRIALRIGNQLEEIRADGMGPGTGRDPQDHHRTYLARGPPAHGRFYDEQFAYNEELNRSSFRSSFRRPRAGCPFSPKAPCVPALRPECLVRNIAPTGHQS